MPVLHRYEGGVGHYVRAKLDDGFVTYQVSPAAIRSIRESGFESGSTISWGLCHRLLEEGHLYTHGSGNDEPVRSNGEVELSEKERQAVDRLGGGDRDIVVPEDVRETLASWGADVESEARAKQLFEAANDPNWCFASIRGFAVARDPDSFEIRSGDATYSFSDSFPWVIVDSRFQSSNVDFRVTVNHKSGPTVTLWIVEGGLKQWAVDGDEASGEHVSLFVGVLPNLFDLLASIPDYHIDVGNWHFRDGKRVKLDREYARLIGETIQSLAETYGLVVGPATGRVASREYAGFGRIQVDGTDATIPFTPRSCTQPGIEKGDKVGFDVELVKETHQAKQVTKIDSSP